MTFTTTTTVRFADVDPAGIVFYPRFFEMLNGAVEDWFASMGLDFRTMHLERHVGVPTVRLECDFLAPCELGDELSIAITPTNVGRSSCTIEYALSAAGTMRLKAVGVLVFMDLAAKKSIPWPDDLRAQLEAA